MAEYDRPDLMLRVRVGVEFQSSADEIGEMKQFKFNLDKDYLMWKAIVA